MSGIKPRKLFFIVLAVLLLMVGLLATLPLAARMAAVSLLEKQGVQADIEDVNLNLFTGRLEVTGAHAKAQSGDGFSLQRVLVEMRYLPLFERRIHLRRLEVLGTQVDVVRTAENDITVAGMAIPQSGDSGEPSGWGFGLDQAAIADTSLRYRDEQLDETLVVNATSVSDVATWEPAQSISFSALGALKGSELRLNGSIQPFGEIIQVNLQVETSALPVDALGSYLQQTLEGTLATDLDMGLVYSAQEGTTLSVEGEASLASLQGKIPQQPYSLSASALTWSGALEIGLPAAAEESMRLSGNSEVAASNVKVTEDGKPRTLFLAENLAAGQIQLQALNDIKIAAIQGQNLLAMQDAEAEPLLRLAGLTADTLSLADLQNLDIETITVSGLQGELRRNAAAQWNYETWLPPPAGQPEQDAAEVSGDERLDIAIGEVVMTDQSRITVADSSVKPGFETELEDIVLRLKRLDTAQPDQQSPVALTARVGRYGELDAQGYVKPFAEATEADVRGKLSNANLVPLSGFTRRIVSHRISQGTVSSDITVKLAGGKIDALFDLVLNKLKVAAVKGGSGEFEAQTGMPLTTALGLMRDRDDNVRLKLPITGDMANPDIDINHVIQKAVFKAVQVGVLSFYSPLGVVMAADKLVQFATALRFNPITFAAGSTLLTQEQAAYIDNMAQLLAGRPQVQVSVCGFAAPIDRQAVAEQEAAQNKGFFGLFKREADAEDVPEDVLRTVAQKRAELVADYLVARNVNEDQLILCDPVVELTGETAPRVEVSM